MNSKFVEVSQLSLSESAILFDDCVFIVALILLVIALFYIGSFLVDYLQRKWEEYWQNNRLKLTYDCEMHMKFGLHWDNLDKSDKDDAKKSSEAKDKNS
ncbi:MAG: hypothetical protein K2F85_08930 [Helicobacter sp.]|nr:hypothetical protein [Helicobacter sp.]